MKTFIITLIFLALSNYIFCQVNYWEQTNTQKKEDHQKLQKKFNRNDDVNTGKNVQVITSSQLNANNISTWYRTNGSFNRDPQTGNAGFEWSKGSGKYARYASGVWLGCVSGNDTLIAVAEFAYDYKNGYVDDTGNPQGSDDPLYRIYTINRGNTSEPDYLNWPVNQGAYVNAQGMPFWLGTQTMFYSYTDADAHTTNNSSLISLKAQILQTNWCYTNIGLENVQFTEFRIINRSNAEWQNTYVAFWTDDDLGTATDDKIGCDTLRDLGYTYNATDNDGVYGTAPPAVGTKLLRSPVIFTGDNNDTVKYFNPPGSQNLIVKVGYKFTGMNVFNTYNGATPPPSDPQTPIGTYRVLEGKWQTNEQWINPLNGLVTTKVYSGDPVSGTGWLTPGQSDRRFVQSFGPFNMSPNDTQSIIVAQVIARGTSNLNSISKLRELSDFVQLIYDENFQGVLAVENVSTEIPSEYSLSQNYPNPFNPSTNIEFSISEFGPPRRIGISSAAGGLGFVTLKIYDLQGKEVTTLVNEKLNPGSYKVKFDGSGLPSGIYFYRLSTGEFTETKSMILLK